MVIQTGNVKDLTGKKFGRLKVLYKLHNYHKQKTYYLCVCDCGSLTEVRGTSLSRGDSKSCGCLAKENKTKHNKTNTRLYKIWLGMKRRCDYIKHKRYKDYGGRGIVVCDEWKDDFMKFHDWAISNGYNDNLTIDRIDVNGNYEPNNCRWITNKQQARNRRSNRNCTINGVTRCLMEWCEIYKLNYWTVVERLNRDWSIEKALGINS